MFFRRGLKCVVLLALLLGLGSLALRAQETTSTVHGTVTDPDNAVIPGATITLTPAAGKALTTQSKGDGTFAIDNVPPGTYSITATMNGFATFVRQGVKITSGHAFTANVKMAVQATDQTVQVTADSVQLSVDQDSNASSTTIKGKDLEALSDDPDELQSELTALAGPAAGPNGGQIYIDGFTGGQLPPKSSIREIRINQNPFSAEYDKLGYGRVEVFTKPGTDKFHGSVQVNGNDSAFNSSNPLLNVATGQAPVTQPPYHTIFNFGNVTGPLTKNSSFSFGESYRQIQDNAIVNGTILAPSDGSTQICNPGDQSCIPVSYQEAIPVPQTRVNITPRLDVALGEKNTLTARYQFERNSRTNNGVGNLVTASAANDDTSTEHTLQVSDSQIVSDRIINETRFEFQRDEAIETALSTAPTLAVQGNFTTGGSSTGSSDSIENHYEVQNYTSIQLKKNFIRLGGRLRSTSDSTTTTQGTNGQFTYPTLNAYLRNQPSKFSITKINSGTNTTSVDLGLYAEDDWKPLPNLTISYGLRYETQNFIGDHHDFAPRVSFAYGLGNSKGAPKTVLRGGFGIFYDRFTLTNQVTVKQQNGTNQVISTANYTYTDSTPSTCTPGTIDQCSTTTSGGNTTYDIAPNLRTPYMLQAAVGVDQQIFRDASLSVNFLHAHGVHQFISQNINAPFVSNGMYAYPLSGGTTVGPNPNAPIVQQFQSEADFQQNELIVNANVRTGSVSLFGYYALNFANSDTAGATSFPSVPYNIKADYGRATFDTRHRVFLGGNYAAPFYISISPFLIAASGTPYNITTGRDQNGDSEYVDRPAFQPGRTSASCTVASDFVSPDPGTSYTPIPINYCTGPANFTMNLRVSKTFGFGPLTEAARERQQRGGPGGPGGFGSFGHGGGHGRGGPRGGGRGFGGSNTGHLYNLSFGAQFQNLFNYEALSPPGGVLSSTKFGTSTQLAGNPYTSNSAVSRIQIFTSFTF